MPENQTELTEEEEQFFNRAHTGNRLGELMEEARDNPDSMARKVALDLKLLRENNLFSRAGIDYRPENQKFEVSSRRWSWSLMEDDMEQFRRIGFRIVSVADDKMEFRHERMMEDSE